MCMVCIYPTEFMYQIRQTFVDLHQEDIVTWLDTFIFYLFWGGVYHSPQRVSGHGYFYNFYGYLVILVLLLFEKNGQQWAYNRFGCDKVTEDRFRLMESELARLRETRNKSPNLNETIQEDENESRSSEGLAKPTQPVEEKPEELR